MPRAAPIAGRLVEHHHVGERPLEEAVEAARHRLQDLRQRVELRLAALQQARAVLADDDVRLIRPARREGDVRDDLAIAAENPLTVAQLAPEQLAGRAAAEPLIGLELPRRDRRQERKGVDLAVRMMERRPDLDAAVL